MSALRPYRLSALNNAWANATLYAAVTGLDEAAFTAPRPGFFDTLSRTLNHIHEADLYFLDALEEGGKGRSIFQRDDVTDPAALAALQADADMRLARFCHDLTEADLEATRRMERPQGIATERVDAMLLQLFQHQIHHRGQAHVGLKDAGIAPPQLDEFHLEFNRAPSAQAYFG